MSQAVSVAIIVAAVSAVSCTAPNQTLRERSRSAARFLVVNVNVLTMTDGKVRRQQTVLIEGNVVKAIKPASDLKAVDDRTAEPSSLVDAETQIIDGTGRYLIPGLADMHMHFGDENDLVLYLAHGVTRVRAMSEMNWWARAIGFPKAMTLRQRVTSGERLGPDIMTAGMILEGSPKTSPIMRKVETVEAAEREVQRQHRDGYDLIKVYDHLKPEVFRAIVTSAHRLGLPVAGHAPKAMAPTEVLRSGLSSVEHLTAYFDNDRVAYRVDATTSLDELVALTAHERVANVPTLVIFDRLVPLEYYDRIDDHPLAPYLGWQTHFLWRQTLKAVYETNITWDGKRDDYAATCAAAMRDVVSRLHRAKAPILAGTDATFVGVFPGDSLHRELELLVDAGLSPYEALRTATANVGDFLGEPHYGRVEVGAPGSVVLLDANPLLDIRNTRAIRGVLHRGRWYSAEALNAALDHALGH